MPSKDRVDPRLNEWMEREGLTAPERLSATEPAEQRPVGSRTARRERRMSGQVQRLARRIGKSPDEIASKLSEDTLRRTQYPVIEQTDEHGRRVFKHDPGISEGRIAARS